MEFIGTKGTIVVGTVVSNSEGTGAGAGKVRNIKVKCNVRGTEKEISVAFWNGDKPMADRAASISEGSPIMIYCGVKDNKYTGYSYQYPGHSMSIEVEGNEGENKREITLGRIYKNTSTSGKEYYSMKLSKYDAAEGANKDVTIFVNFSAKTKENAEKVLGATEGGKMVALVSFPIQTTVENDRETNSLVAMSFERLD